TESVGSDGRSLRLSAAPNPMSAGAEVTLASPETQPGRIEVLGVNGSTIAVLADGTIPAGRRPWHWEGTTPPRTAPRVGGVWVRARVGTLEAIQRVVRFR